MWCYACNWDVRGDLPLNPMAQIHTSATLLTSRDLTCQRASHISVVAHISWGELTWLEDSVSPALLSPSTSNAFTRRDNMSCSRIYIDALSLIPAAPSQSLSAIFAGVLPLHVLDYSASPHFPLHCPTSLRASLFLFFAQRSLSPARCHTTFSILSNAVRDAAIFG